MGKTSNTGDKGTSSAEAVSEPFSAISGVNGGADNSVLNITGHKLNGRNYLQWSQSVMMYISGRGKDDYLTGEKEMPQKEDPKFKVWRSENNMVMAWLINSMENEIGQTFLFYGTAKEIWEAAKQTYSDSENTAELFELQNNLRDLRQGDMEVTQYFNALTRYWQQLDVFEELQWSCPEDSTRYRKIVDRERIFAFLAGLNKNLDEVRGRILATKPLPPIREAFSEVRREESRKKVMMKEASTPSVMEGSALISRGQGQLGHQSFETRGKKGRPWCDHCHKPGHTRDTCWKIHGRPANMKTNGTRDQSTKSDKEGRSFVAAGEEPSAEALFSKEQISLLQKMFGQVSTSQSVMGTGAVAQKGKFLSALNVKTERLKPWIVDSGASDHMTGDRSLFKTFNSCSEGFKVRIADGSVSTVAGKGTIEISENLTLNAVLFVPNLSYNLLSISKLTKDKNCITKFSPTCCEFQDSGSGRTIGNARQSEGLYLLEANVYNKNQALNESSLPDIFTTNSWVSPNAITRSRSNGKSSPEGASPNGNTPAHENAQVSSSASRIMIENHPISSFMAHDRGEVISNLVESNTSRPDPFNMAPLNAEITIDLHQSEVNMEEKSIPELPDVSSTPAVSNGSSVPFLEPDEVSIPSINASYVTLYRGSQRIKLLHKDITLQLQCARLKVRFGISMKFVDHAGRPRLNFVVDARPSLSKVLDSCDDIAQRLSVESGSSSEWRCVVTRNKGFFNYPTVRLHIPTAVCGNIAIYATEIYQKENSGSVQRLVFSKFDASELNTLLTPGTFVDAFFSLDPYDYQQNAGLKLVAKKMIIHSD